MPLPATQLIKEPLQCEGGLLMIEITEEVFTPGSRRWKEVVDHVEHRRVMQLFLFTLGVCVDLRARVVLETVVSQELDTVHGGKLSNMVHVLGYRLWIPLKWSAEVDNFGRAVTSSLSTSPTEGAKRRRIDEVEPAEIHLQRVRTYHQLLRAEKD